MECLRVIGRVCRTEDTDPWLPDCRPHKECTESPTSPLHCLRAWNQAFHGSKWISHNCPWWYRTSTLHFGMHSSLSFIRHAPTASNLSINVYLNLYVHVCRLVCFYMCLSVAVRSPLYPWHAAQPWLWNTKCSGLKREEKCRTIGITCRNIP